MAYTPTYVAGDLSAIVMDLVGQVMVALVSNASIIVGLVILVIIVELTTGLISKVFGGLLGSFKRK